MKAPLSKAFEISSHHSRLTSELYHRSRIVLPPEGIRTTAFVHQQHTNEIHRSISNHAKNHPGGLCIRMQDLLELVDLESELSE